MSTNVTNSYCKVSDVTMKEHCDWHILKSAHKAIHEATWPSYTKLEMVSHSRLLHSSNARSLKMTLETGTFLNSASKLFNCRPVYLRNYTDYFHIKTLLLNEAKKNLN